jgi:hypothetical protein
MTSEAQFGASAWVCDFVLENQLQKLNPVSVVDFGAGGGKNGKIVRKVLQHCKLIAVEGYEPAAKALAAGPIYDTAVHSLLQDWVVQAPGRY